MSLIFEDLRYDIFIGRDVDLTILVIIKYSIPNYPTTFWNGTLFFHRWRR